MPAPTSSLVAMLLIVLLTCSAATARIMPIMKPPPPYDMYILTQEWQPDQHSLKISSFVPANLDGSLPQASCKDKEFTMDDIAKAGGESALEKWIGGVVPGPQNYLTKQIWVDGMKCSALTPSEWLAGSVEAVRALPGPVLVGGSIDAQQLRDVYGRGVAVLECAGGALLHIRTCHDFKFAPIACPAVLLAADSCTGVVRI
ncbi:hypothetical protein HDU77_006527 [Chytriomyces hyalinus]|nr:hypothetical protein HDU77_006527 [Chytriomyces hyalinus]